MPTSHGEWAAKIAEVGVRLGDAAWREQFKKRFVVLPDIAFDFLCETGTEVNTRVKIDDETKTVATGALWTEESLPPETILAGIVQCDRVFRPQRAKDDSITPNRMLLESSSQPRSPLTHWCCKSAARRLLAADTFAACSRR